MSLFLCCVRAPFKLALLRDWSKSITGWAGAERGWVVQFSATLRGWVTLFYYIDRHTILILTRQLTTLDI